jgi:hypothetical protein
MRNAYAVQCIVVMLCSTSVATLIAMIVARALQVERVALSALYEIQLSTKDKYWHTMSSSNLHMTIMATYVRPADSLRSVLKTAGFNARRVSVRHDGSTLRVTIRDASASLTKVKAIAETYESVRYCQATGEILSGGYVSSHITAVMW